MESFPKYYTHWEHGKWMDHSSITFTPFFFHPPLEQFVESSSYCWQEPLPNSLQQWPWVFNKTFDKKPSWRKLQSPASTKSHPVICSPVDTNYQVHICLWGFLSLISRVAPSIPVCMFMRLNPHLSQSFNRRLVPSLLEGENVTILLLQIKASGASQATQVEGGSAIRMWMCRTFKQACVRAFTFSSLRGVKMAPSGLQRIRLCRLIFTPSSHASLISSKLEILQRAASLAVVSASFNIM